MLQLPTKGVADAHAIVIRNLNVARSAFTEAEIGIAKFNADPNNRHLPPGELIERRNAMRGKAVIAIDAMRDELAVAEDSIALAETMLDPDRLSAFALPLRPIYDGDSIAADHRRAAQPAAAESYRQALAMLGTNLGSELVLLATEAADPKKDSELVFKLSAMRAHLQKIGGVEAEQQLVKVNSLRTTIITRATDPLHAQIKEARAALDEIGVRRAAQFNGGKHHRLDYMNFKMMADMKRTGRPLNSTAA